MLELFHITKPNGGAKVVKKGKTSFVVKCFSFDSLRY